MIHINQYKLNFTEWTKEEMNTYGKLSSNQKTKCQLRSNEHVVDIPNSDITSNIMMAFKNFQFARVNSCSIFYQPLCDITESKVLFFIRDERTNRHTIASIYRINGNEMNFLVLDMSYYVAREDMKFIKLIIKVINGDFKENTIGAQIVMHWSIGYTNSPMQHSRLCIAPHKIAPLSPDTIMNFNAARNHITRYNRRINAMNSDVNSLRNLTEGEEIDSEDDWRNNRNEMPENVIAPPSYWMDNDNYPYDFYENIYDGDINDGDE
jgi:hypothetical protein